MKKEQKTCKVCGDTPEIFSPKLGVCLNCIRSNPDRALKIAAEVHARSRLAFDLPPSPPRDPQGAACNWCVNRCRIPEGERGYCGLRINRKGKLIHLAGAGKKAVVSCICYFGGDPTPQLPFAFKASRLAQRIKERPDPPFLVASTLLIPGYVDAREVGNIARFISSLDPEIPYSLLAFYSCFEMNDLPTTSSKQAEDCLNAARESGLKRIRIGNIHLLR